MDREAQSLDDADFTEEAPLGYLSAKHRERYIPIMATLLVVAFLAQNILPYALSFAAMPLVLKQAASVGMHQYGRMTAWRGDLWYPALDGGSRGGCKLLAIDTQGKLVDKPAVAVDTQPEWLIADGDRLWAVSKNEVAEIYADGSRPVVMHPTRYLQNASTPFLYEGKLAVIDSGDQATWSIFVFENGEWIPRVDVDLAISAAGANSSTDADAPADASSPEQPASPNQALQAQRRAAQPFLNSPSATIDRIQVVPVGDSYHIVVSRGGVLYHCETLPLLAEDDAQPPAPPWNEIYSLATTTAAFPGMRAASINPWSLTVVAGAPAVLTEIAGRKNSPQLWRYVDGKWQISAQGAGSGFNAEIATFTLPEEGCTFAIVNSMGGMSPEILELHPTRIQKVKTLGGSMSVTNPATSGFLTLQLLIQAAAVIPTILLILIGTAMMLTHRERHYFKGNKSVEYASLLRRSIAAFIDLAIWFGPIFAGWYWWFTAEGEASFLNWQTNLQSIDAFVTAIAPGLLATFGWLVFVGFVMWLTIAWGGFTIGKLLCGVRVVRTSLEPPGLFRALIRMIIWPVETLFFQGIIAFSLITLTPYQQRLADLVIRCVVVKAGSLRRARLEMATINDSP